MSMFSLFIAIVFYLALSFFDAALTLKTTDLDGTDDEENPVLRSMLKHGRKLFFEVKFLMSLFFIAIIFFLYQSNAQYRQIAWGILFTFNLFYVWVVYHNYRFYQSIIHKKK